MNIEYDSEFYVKFKKFVKKYMKLMYKINATGLENIPTDSNYVLAGNHLNILDSWVLVALTDENLRFMVNKKLYNTPMGEWFFKKLGTFDIDPNKMDVKAVKSAINLLKQGEIVVIFPEGQTHSMKVNVPFKGGVPVISQLGKTVIVPFGLSGNYAPFSSIDVNFGEPIDFSKLDLTKEEKDEYLEKTVRDLEPKKLVKTKKSN